MSEPSVIANPLAFNLSTSVYSLSAIMNAAYDYIEQATIEVEKISEEQVRVSLIPKVSEPIIFSLDSKEVG